MQERTDDHRHQSGHPKHDCGNEQVIFVQRMREQAEKVEWLAEQIGKLQRFITEVDSKVDAHRKDFVKAYRSQHSQGEAIQSEQLLAKQLMQETNAAVTEMLGDMQLIKPDVESLRQLKGKYDLIKKWANRVAYCIAGVSIIYFFSILELKDAVKLIVKAVI